MERFLIFISYRRGESAGYAGRLHESLERRFGDGHVFRDVDELEPGQDFVDAIAARLRDCAACLVVIGSEWLLVSDRSDRRRLDQPNDYVRLEIQAALARSDLLLVPVLVEGATMPSAEDLPATIRALSRRHALSLRDETWDTDVDRLVTTLEKKIGRRTLAGDINPASRLPRLLPGKLIVWSALAGGLFAAILFLTRGTDTSETRTASETSINADAGAGTTARPSAPPRAIVMPRLAEAANGSLIYTLLSGDISSRGNTNTLRLRVRLSNEGRSPTIFWDNSFRFVVPGQTVASTGGLGEAVDGYAMKQGIITFELPAGTARGTLQLVAPNVVAEIPLDLKATNAPSSVDNADTGDALSRAQVVRVTADPVALVGGDVTYTLDRMIARRFTNTLRIVATVRVTNNGRYPWFFGSGAIRLLVDGQLFAPFESPNAGVEPSSTMSGDFLFHVPPATRRVTLRVLEPGAETSFDLPSF